VTTRNVWRAIAMTMLTGALLAPGAAPAQESKCSPCEAEERDRVVRRYEQEIERARREIATLQRQLASSESVLDSASVRRLNERMQRAISQLSRAHVRQAASLQSLGERSRTTVRAVTPPPSEWMTQAIDGYIGVLWSASVHVEKPKNGEALWTFHDYPHVEAVERESPAERAGIQVGDMILAFDGKDLRAGKIPMNAVLRPGSTIAVRLNREDRTRSVNVRVEERPRRVRARTPRPPVAVEPFSGEWVIEPPEIADVPGAPPTAPAPRTGVTPSPLGAAGAFGLLGNATVGAEMIPLDETLGEPYGTEHGLLILRVGPRTPAARAGIQKGDVLISVDGRELHSVPALIRAVERAEKAEKSELRIELLRKKDRKVVVLQW
jgi:predicted metalloprotease with PDZ domain